MTGLVCPESPTEALQAAIDFAIHGTVWDGSEGSAATEDACMAAVWPLVATALDSVRSDNEALKAKLALPCGSCHPCDNWADETWRREGKKPPAVVTWQDTLAAKAELLDDNQRLTADLALVRFDLTQLREAVTALGDEFSGKATAASHDVDSAAWNGDALMEPYGEGQVLAYRDAAQRLRAVVAESGASSLIGPAPTTGNGAGNG